MAENSINIWPDEDSRFNDGAALNGYPAWMTQAEKVRAERIAQARMLFDGKHREFYLAGGRSQFPYRQVRTVGGGVTHLYTACNLLRLVSLKSADLLFGESPLITGENPAQTDAIKAIVDRSGLHQVVEQAALDASVENEAHLEAVVYDDEVYLQQVPNEEITPIGAVMPDGQYAAYLRREVRGELVLERTYRAGSIEWKLYRVREGKRTEADLGLWEGLPKVVTAAQPVQATGIEWNTITWIPNLKVRRKPVSDYDGGLVGMQDVVNAKNSQLALVILRHAQPKLIVPEQALDETGTLRDMEVFTARQGDPEAKYLTWDAQLDAAQKDRAFAVNQLLVQSETSPVLLGMKEGAAPDAYRKVRLEAFNSITKAARKAVYWTEGLRTAMTVACMLQQTIPTAPKFTVGKVSVDLRDGIPADELDEANRLATLKGSDIVDDRWALEQILPDAESVDAVMQRKEKRRAAELPTILMNETGEE